MIVSPFIHFIKVYQLGLAWNGEGWIGAAGMEAVCGWEGKGRLREGFWRGWRRLGGVEEWSRWIDLIMKSKKMIKAGATSLNNKEQYSEKEKNHVF